MNAREIKFKWLGSVGLARLWSGCRGWIPHVASVALVLASAVTVLAAGIERSPDQLTMLSVVPTPTTVPSSSPSGGFYYTVQRGDTLFSIAVRFGTTVQAIVNANGIINPNQIFYGQVFWIPSGSGGTTGSGTYVVRRGDTLYSIARRFGTTYLVLAAANGLHSPYRIYVGQRLVIPGQGTAVPPPSQRVYIVRAGDTLWSIALRYGTTPWAIAAANGLWNLNLIYVGQRLVIP
jgi:LysM repeat protein